MHPEVLRSSPGDCPSCGMALEPLAPQLDEGQNPELADMERRFWIALALTLPVFAIAMSEMWPGDPLTALASRHSLAW